MMTFFTGPRRCFLASFGVGEAAGRFDDDLRAHRLPGKLGGILFGENLDRLAVDGDAVGAGGDLVGQIAENGIVLQQVRQGFGIGEIVDRDEFDIRDR